MKVIIDARTTQDEVKLNGIGRYSRFVVEYMIRNQPETQFYLLMYNAPSTIDEFLKSNPKNVTKVSLGKYLSKGGIEMILLNLDLVFRYSLLKALRKIDLKDAVFFSPYFWRGLPTFLLPTVVYFHDFAYPHFNIYSTISPFHNFLRFIHYWWDFIFVLKSKFVLTAADYTINDFKKRFPKFDSTKLKKTLLGVEKDFGQNDFEMSLPTDWKDRKYIIYLGGAPSKNKNSIGVVLGYKFFINSLLKQGWKREKLPYLVIAGKNFEKDFSKDANDLREDVDANGLTDLVWFSGKYTDAERWDLVKNAFAFIHLSLFEGFGFAVAEAMSIKVPVIAHNGTTYPEVVGDGGILVDGLNVEEVGSAMMKLFMDKEYAKKIGERGYEISKKYDWNITAGETFKFIKQAYNG